MASAETSILVVVLGALLGLWAGPVAAAPGSPCPHGFNKDGTCRDEPFSSPTRPSRQRLTFRTEPPGAAIFIDGKPLLRKDGTQAVTDYTHTQRLDPKLSLIELRKDGFETAKIWRRIERYGRQEVEYRLVPLVPIKVHNLTDVACALDVERIDASFGGAPDEPYTGEAEPAAIKATEQRRGGWVALRRRRFPARTTITVELAGPGRYELRCSADNYEPQCKTVELELAAGEWSVVQRDGCGPSADPGRRDGSIDLQLRPRAACVQIDPDMRDVPLWVWTAEDPARGCGEPPPDAAAGSPWWSQDPSVCGRRDGVPYLEDSEPDWRSLERRRDDSGLVEDRKRLLEYVGARYGDTVCIRVPALPGRPDAAVVVDSLTKVVTLSLAPTDDRPEVVSLRREQAAAANEQCVDETRSPAERARVCAHLAFLLEKERERERMQDAQARTPGRSLRRLRGSSVDAIDPRQLWQRACEQGNARACEVAGLRAAGCTEGDPSCLTADEAFAQACALGRTSACLRRAAITNRYTPQTIEQLYRLSEDHPLLAKRSPRSSVPAKSMSEVLRYPAVGLSFDPRGPARSWQLQASWLNLFHRSSSGWLGAWLKLLAPTLVSVEQRTVADDGTVGTRRIYGGLLAVEGVARLTLEVLRQRRPEVLLFASGGGSLGLGWVDGFWVAMDGLAGLGFTVQGWGLEAGVRSLRAPWVAAPPGEIALRSSRARLGVYVSLETNFDLRRRRRR